ncbi:MAG: hypothetical protein GX297_09320 [Treponema sp.]|jgi:ABC-type bacteriocin/lantibiotic exporter with double-glycine peptidase domain|nr:hypothetical protein [Treponema sp.]
MKYFQQLDITDCGAACIAMIASNFGRHLSIAEVRAARYQFPQAKRE